MGSSRRGNLLAAETPSQFFALCCLYVIMSSYILKAYSDAKTCSIQRLSRYFPGDAASYRIRAITNEQAQEDRVVCPLQLRASVSTLLLLLLLLLMLLLL